MCDPKRKEPPPKPVHLLLPVFRGLGGCMFGEEFFNSSCSDGIDE